MVPNVEPEVQVTSETSVPENSEVHVKSIYVLTKRLGVFGPQTKVTVESTSASGRIVTISPNVDRATKRKVRRTWFLANSYLHTLK